MAETLGNDLLRPFPPRKAKILLRELLTKISISGLSGQRPPPALSTSHGAIQTPPIVKIMASPTTHFGNAAETAACRWLQSGGYRIVDRNWRRPWGELDIVAVKGGVIHFIEVKASATLRAGFEPFLRADPRKMLKVQRTARTWLAANRISPDTGWQMDVLSVIMDALGPVFELIDNI